MNIPINKEAFPKPLQPLHKPRICVLNKENAFVLQKNGAEPVKDLWNKRQQIYCAEKDDTGLASKNRLRIEGR